MKQQFKTLFIRIWAELKNLADHRNKTILITTHYIQEANQANCVSTCTDLVIQTT